MSTSIMTRPANLKDFLDNLFGFSAPVALGAFSSSVFAEPGVTPGVLKVDLVASTLTSF